MDACSNFRARGVSVVVSLALGLVLASCATEPAGPGGSAAPQSTPGDPDSTSRYGRLVVNIVNQKGQGVAQATVELNTFGNTPYRASGITNFEGRVEFKGVPMQVGITVSYKSGTYADTVNVPQTGVPVDARIILDP